MNGIEELALGSADVAAISGQDIADSILELAYPKFVLSQLYKKVQIPDGHKNVVVPLRPSATINVSQNVVEGTSISLSSYSFTGQTISASKQGIRFEIDNEALESTKRNLMEDLLNEASNEWAKVQEQNAQTVALDLRTESISSWTNGTLGSTTFVPIIAITSVGAGTISWVDYAKGSIALTSSISAGTVSFLYSNMCKNNNQFISVGDAGTLSLWDAFTLRSTLVANSMYPDIVLVNDIDLPTFLYSRDIDANFLVTTKQYTTKENILSGEIGMLFPLKILCSPLVPEGIGVLIDSARLGYNVIKRPLEAVQEDRSEIDSTWYHLWSENSFVVADSFAVGVLVNAKTGQYPATNL